MSVGSERPVVVYILKRYPQLSQTFVRNEVHALRATGVDVEVCSMRPTPEPAPDPAWGGPVERLGPVGRWAAVRALAWWAVHHPRRLAAYVALARRLEDKPGGLAWRQLPGLARSLRGRRVVACHTHFAWEGLPAVLLLGRLLGVPSSMTVHAHDIYDPHPHLVQRLEELDRLVTVCEFNIRHLRRNGLWARPVAVVPCGVDVPEVEPLAELGPPRVVTIARLVQKKGVLPLLEAFAVVRVRVPGVTLDVVGDGPQRAEVEAAVERLGLGASVRLLGARPHAEALAVLEGATVFALACQVDATGDSDALPVVLREAMARAVPVVTTAVAGIPELIDDATGWVVEPGDVEALSEVLLRALTDAGEAQARGQRARQRVLATGTLAHTAEGMRGVFGLAGPLPGTGAPGRGVAGR